MIEPVLVVEARSIVRLGRFQKLWVVGWCVASLAIASTAIQTARLYEAHQNSLELSKLMGQVKMVQDEQRTINSTYIKAWESQQATANLVITWGQYIKDRDDIVTKNKNEKPVNLMTQYSKR